MEKLRLTILKRQPKTAFKKLINKAGSGAKSLTLGKISGAIAIRKRFQSTKLSEHTRYYPRLSECRNKLLQLLLRLGFQLLIPSKMKEIHGRNKTMSETQDTSKEKDTLQAEDKNTAQSQDSSKTNTKPPSSRLMPDNVVFVQPPDII